MFFGAKTKKIKKKIFLVQFFFWARPGTKNCVFGSQFDHTAIRPTWHPEVQNRNIPSQCIPKHPKIRGLPRKPCLSANGDKNCRGIKVDLFSSSEWLFWKSTGTKLLIFTSNDSTNHFVAIIYSFSIVSKLRAEEAILWMHWNSMKVLINCDAGRRNQVIIHLLSSSK